MIAAIWCRTAAMVSLTTDRVCVTADLVFRTADHVCVPADLNHRIPEPEHSAPDQWRRNRVR